MADTIPEQMVQIMLVQNAQDPKAWKLMTIWKSREDFAAEPVPSLLNVAEYSKIGG